jgi:hypothetical protein
VAGGLTSAQALQIVRSMGDVNLVGMDGRSRAQLRPEEITALAAAHIACDLLCVAQSKTAGKLRLSESATSFPNTKQSRSSCLTIADPSFTRAFASTTIRCRSTAGDRRITPSSKPCAIRCRGDRIAVDRRQRGLLCIGFGDPLRAGLRYWGQPDHNHTAATSLLRTVRKHNASEPIFLLADRKVATG